MIIRDFDFRSPQDGHHGCRDHSAKRSSMVLMYGHDALHLCGGPTPCTSGRDASCRSGPGRRDCLPSGIARAAVHHPPRLAWCHLVWVRPSARHIARFRHAGDHPPLAWLAAASPVHVASRAAVVVTAPSCARSVACGCVAATRLTWWPLGCSGQVKTRRRAPRSSRLGPGRH
jgi:hypothetical protein